mmetsp:Transcript_32476/g.74642  ORF Transcript_32476/g.74642 Transcript_32476/m.74642 type:complete len:82 (+) Transcript_32476:209-454(+)
MHQTPEKEKGMRAEFRANMIDAFVNSFCRFRFVWASGCVKADLQSDEEAPGTCGTLRTIEIGGQEHAQTRNGEVWLVAECR